MIRKLIAKLLGLGHAIQHELWLFELPDDAPEAMVLYHDLKMHHRHESIEADKVYNAARQKMWDDCKAIGKSNSLDLPDDHPIKLEWRKASAARDAIRKQHNARTKAAHAAMTEAEAKRYNELWKDWCYSDDNAKKPIEHLSPSGRFKLVVTCHETSPGCWSYTKGVVSHAESGEIIASIRRNYSSFPFAWLEEHVDRHEYLICGEDYQGQTFVQLDTGKVVNDRSVGAEMGHGFCWAGYRLLGDKKTLLVDGCYWACPYELKFFDVSDPMAGWPEINLPGNLDHLDPEKSEVTIDGDDIVWLEKEHVYKPTGEREYDIERKWDALFREVQKAEAQEAGEETIAAAKAAVAAHDEAYPHDPEDDPEMWEQVVNRRVRLTLGEDEEGEPAFVVVEDWKSEWQLERDRKYAEWREKDRENRDRWLAEDTFYQHLVETVGRDAFSLSYSHQSMMARWKGDINEVYFRASVRQDGWDKTATLIWGHNDGPIKTELWVKGKGNVKTPEFPRSLDGLNDAWAAAVKHIGREAA